MRQIHTLLERFHNVDLGILFIRLALAAAFIFHGWQKIQAIDVTAGFFAQGGIDWVFGALFWTYVVAYAEFLGGIALLLGVFVRYAGIVLAVAMAVAVFYVHWQGGFSLANNGYEYALTLLLASLALVTTGGGAYSLAKIFRK